MSFPHYVPLRTDPLSLDPGIRAHTRSLITAFRSVFAFRTAKVWRNFQLEHNLTGHDASVLAVLSLGNDEYLTGTLLHKSCNQIRD
jgi:hypothetical protein